MLCCSTLLGQHRIEASAYVNPEEKSIHIHQQLYFTNTTDTALTEVYLNDWNHAFSAKTTPLAERFAEDYVRRFHYAYDHERGRTEVHKVHNDADELMAWERLSEHPDVIKISLPKALAAGESTNISLKYSLSIPDQKFTGFGFENGSFKLRYWLILPAMLQENQWKIYSHKNLNDLFVPKIDADLLINLPSTYQLTSALKTTAIDGYADGTKGVHLQTTNQTDFSLYLSPNDTFESMQVGGLEVVSNLEKTDVQPALQTLIVDRVVHFLEDRLGKYPHDKILISQQDYQENPVYGFNQLPRFIRPFPDGFQYDIKLVKALTKKYIEKSLLLNPREDRWLMDAMHIYLMMEYVNTFYPDVKLIGNFSEVIGLRWFHAADLYFNDRYPFFFLNMARLNLDQPLTQEQDSLIKFNKNIGNPYKAGVGFNYVKQFLEDKSLDESIKEFYTTYQLKPSSSTDFETILKAKSPKNIDWFFDEYVNTNKWIDLKITDVRQKNDSLWVTIKNKEKNSMPISLFGLKGKKVVAKYWVEQVIDEKTVVIPNDDFDRLALNHDGVIPERNRRNNYHRVSTLLHKPLQVRLLEDVEDPSYTQFFLIPEFDYNLYDGLTIGPKLFNKNILRKDFTYKIAPKYGFTSGAVVGSASFVNNHRFQNQALHLVQYGLSGSRYSYAQNLYYHRVTPYINILFRDQYLRDNENQGIGLRSVNVFRDRNALNTVDEPDYSVLNAQYNYNNRNFNDYFTTSVDYQIAKKFSKVSVTSKWRKLFLNNRQLEFRLFAGAFLFNKSRNSDYFSFALDRPTDYLFDYNYYGRSESSGLFSQQFIEAEGGFKSQLQPAFANQWITTLNGSFTIWNWIHAYGDVGLVKNRGEQAEFLYDSGIRLSLVQDYFELFFPLYSSLGWEAGQANYDQKIRFIVSLDFNTLLRLFTRRWY